MDETNSLRSRVQRAVPWTIANAIGRMGLSLIGTILLVRHLDPVEYGVWALLVGLAAPVYLFISFGYPHKFTRFLPGLGPSSVAPLIWPVLVRRLALTALASALLVAAFPLYGERIGLAGYNPHLVLYQLALIGNLGSTYATLILGARFLQREVTWVTVPHQAALVLGTAVGIVRQEELLFFVALASSLALANLAFCWFLLLRLFGMPSWSAVRRPSAEPADERRYRRASYVGDYGVTFLNTEVDRYLIAVFAQSSEVAIYAVATTIVERSRSLLPTQLFRPLMEATFFRRFEETGRTEALDEMFRLLFLIIAVVCFLFLALFAPLGTELLTVLFRPEYAASYPIIGLYLVAMTFHQMPAGLILKALKRADVLVYAQLAVVLNLGLGLLLVPRFGGIGMAFATAISVIVKNLIMYLWAKRLLRVRMPWIGLAKCVAAALMTWVLVVLFKQWADWDDLATLLLCGPAAGLSYAVFLRLLGPLDAAQRRQLVSAMPPSVARPLSAILG